MIYVKTLDGDYVYINLDFCVMLKWHPSNKQKSAGLIILSGGKELFVSPTDFYPVLEIVHDAIQKAPYRPAQAPSVQDKPNASS